MALSKAAAVAVALLVVLAGVGGFSIGSLYPSGSGTTTTSTVGVTTTNTVGVTTTVTAPTTRVITDMLGRNLTVPVNIQRVLTTSPVEMELVYMLAPYKLAGLSFSYDGSPTPGETLPPLVPDNMSGVPVVGGWFGTQTGNFETFIGERPDIIIDSQHSNMTSLATFEQNFAGIPVVELNSSWANDVTTYSAAITFVGNLLGVPQQAQLLLSYYQNALNYVNNVTSQIPVSARVKVYYAEGNNGLSTDPLGSMHTQLLAFCGGINVANVTLLPGYGMASVSPEQILLWNPSIIIIGRGSQSSLYTAVMSNTTWSTVSAVVNHEVFVRPDNPFSWFDGPPGPMQILGMYWMVHTLYPAQTAGLDLSGQVKTFYSEFMHFTLNDTQVALLLAGGPS